MADNMSREQLMARIAELEAAASARTNGEITFRNNHKGTVSIFGLQRFPVSLYPGQLVRLLDAGDKLRKHIAEGVKLGQLSLDKDVAPKNPVAERVKETAEPVAA